MENKRFAGNPLLYIQQPTIATPVAPMQHNYYTPKHNQHTSIQKQKTIKHTRTIPLKRSSDNFPIDDEDEILEKKSHEELTTEKKFKDMTIKQKVNYFIDRPDHAPVIKCEVKTNERKYIGVITGLEKDHVLIRVGRRSSSSEIPISNIIDIRIIGF